METPLHFSFEGYIEKQERDFSPHYLVMVPDEIAQAFAAEKIKRVAGFVNKAPFRLALISDGQGQKMLMLSRLVKQNPRIDFGGMIQVQVFPDPNPDQVDLTEEWEELLRQDEEAAAAWEALSPGLKRSYAYHYLEAKRPETRLKRALDLAYKLKTGTTYAEKQKRG